MPISYAPLSQGELYVARPFPVGGGQRRVIIAALLIAALYAGHDLFVPLALAGLLEFVLAPLVRRLTNWGLPKGLSVALVIVLVLALLAIPYRRRPRVPSVRVTRHYGRGEATEWVVEVGVGFAFALFERI
jgi:predicted lysophospholipase L1 biosynthesis ABC-type transport system permease subunit